MKKLLSVILICAMIATLFCGCSCPGGNTSATQETTATEVTPESLFEQNGFTEEDRRKEITLDMSKGLNSTHVKTYIYDRMLNSIDYYDTIQATYYYVPKTGNAYYCSYAIQQGSNPKSKEVIYNTDGDMVTCFFFDGTNAKGIVGDAMYNPVEADKETDDAIFEKASKGLKNVKATEYSEDMLYENVQVDLDELKNSDYVKLVKSRKRVRYMHTTDRNKYYMRENLPELPMSTTHYAPQTMAMGLLDVFKRWDIVKETKLFGRDCFVIKGKSAGEYSAQINVKKYTMIVDKNTGVLLSLEGYSGSNQTVQLKTYDFKVNKKINADIFS